MQPSPLEFLYSFNSVQCTSQTGSTKYLLFGLVLLGVLHWFGFHRYYNLAHAVNEKVLRQPSMLRAGTLRDYQIVGCILLVILALTISFLCLLSTSFQVVLSG